MKQTHILVPIENSFLTTSGKRLMDQGNYPLVDLSEVGVLGTSIIAVHKRYGAANDAYEEGYQQCAKDLLNIKP